MSEVVSEPRISSDAETVRPAISSAPATPIKIRPVALLGPVRDSCDGWALGIHSESAESKALRDRFVADGSYRAQIQLLLVVDGPPDEVRDIARFLRLASMKDGLVHAFDARSGERLTAEPHADLAMINVRDEFLNAPISPWESLHLAPHLERSFAAIDIQLISPPRAGTRFKLDLRPLAERFSQSADRGNAIDFAIQSVELELVDP